MRLPANFHQIRETVVETVFVGRREPRTGITYFGENVDVVAAPVILEPQGAPDPIRSSGWSGVGRAPTERAATVPVALHLNIAGINAVMEDGFLAGKVKPLPQADRVRQGRADGGQLPFTERQVIDPGTSAPYGNRVAIQNTPRIPAASDVAFAGLTYDGMRRRI